ncbi:uncharacterized protein J4E87_005628 [Alternaria ethzedia]|uniref:uncharacterized protein n=1 Tax=Alternaria ethzedia TaxID=181014 RepID=UPI0020C466F1|nr:uncharacterized protein J4E87_005628 [Alternaria ethzedia]KAI4624129.1 hypothetical protein J4E87_005628 [Alternaria ethzedia]
MDKDVPLPTTKLVLRDALRGLAALHAKGMVHTDIKPNNILLDWNDQGGGLEVKEVQIADMEDMVHLPDNHYISGRQWGNWMWRSPEAHAAAAIQKPTDMFSFGLVKTIQSRPSSFDVSYFSDLEDMEGLITYLEDSPWIGYLNFVMANFSEDYPRRPLCLWSDLDEDLKDLLTKMMSMDPKRRITASEALAHKWFADVP